MFKNSKTLLIVFAIIFQNTQQSLCGRVKGYKVSASTEVLFAYVGVVNGEREPREVEGETDSAGKSLFTCVSDAYAPFDVDKQTPLCSVGKYPLIKTFAANDKANPDEKEIHCCCSDTRRMVIV